MGWICIRIYIYGSDLALEEWQHQERSLVPARIYNVLADVHIQR